MSRQFQQSQIGWILKSKANVSYCLHDSGPMVRQLPGTKQVKSCLTCTENQTRIMMTLKVESSSCAYFSSLLW